MLKLKDGIGISAHLTKYPSSVCVYLGLRTNGGIMSMRTCFCLFLSICVCECLLWCSIYRDMGFKHTFTEQTQKDRTIHIAPQKNTAILSAVIEMISRG